MLPRFCKSPVLAPVVGSKTSQWGAYVVFMEFAEDRFTAREAHTYENGMMLAYDRDNHADVYGGLGDFRFGNAWVEGWGYPELVAQEEFEEVWAKALAGRPAVPRRKGLPVWIRMFQEGRYPESPGDWPLRR